ncbi:2-5A-dependent ribonuclease [Patagioenas fasciata monilis]|uniref:2-5A-dependent ribonuclease n=1 Tax=Patagioenas fasciata monilis TaxID=372326 RepID=A0A1V4JXE8_PATFA|nr:2-5A-dependent ribonuclease [Patagioenas fasciata monilis]
MEPRAPRQQETSTPSSMEKAEVLARKLNTAVRDSNVEYVLELLKEGADVNSKVESGWTSLQSAVQADNEELVRLLLDRGACPRARKDNGGTAFIEAAMVGNVSILKLLLDYGLDINDHDDNGFTAFMEAAWYGKEEALEFLYSKGADVNLRRAVSEENEKLHKGGETALMDACRKGHLSVVKTLVQEMGANVNICDNKDRNALIHVLREGCAKKRYESAVSIARFLLDPGGIDVNSKDECGKTPLILAVEMQSADLVEALLEKGEIDIDDADEEGNTALMVAVEKDDNNIAKLLCEKGARTDVGNLIAVANRNRAHNMARLLRQYHARVPETFEDWEPNSKRWRDQLKKLYQTYRPMIGKLKTFQYIQQRIQNTSQGGIYLGLYGGTEVAVRICHSTEGDKEKMFFEKCGNCEHLLKHFQFEKARGYMYLCFPLWEKNLEEHLQEAEDPVDYKVALKMIFQAVRELHSLGFAHQDLHPSNFLIDLGGKIYLADFDNKRALIEGKKELVNSDVEALGRLVLYVLTRGRKPLQQVSTEDLAADSPDYNEALDLVISLGAHDDRGLEGLSKHPYFWSIQTRFKFLKSIWNKIKDLPNQKAIFQAPNVTQSSPYPSWTEEVDQGVLKIMTKPKKGKYYKYKDDVTDLLRFIRNMDEHPDTRITKKIGDHAEYFLRLFPALTIYVYNSLRQQPKYSHFVDIQDTSL